MSSAVPTNHLICNREFVVGAVDPRLFGSFVEHIGRAVYTGIFEPGHPRADARGFRQDVLALIRELGVTVVRYPGGNFVSGYKWEDGVGPAEKRPRRRELAWMATETNQFGTNEFVEWCRLAGIEPMMAVNLGTRGPVEAGELYEYCNHPGGTALSDLRVAHGYERPHGIRLWCLGNEMDAPWQMGTCEPEEYGRRAREAAKQMRFPDANRSSSPPPDVEFVVCGSSSGEMPLFGHWERRVLEQCFHQVQHVSLHTYYGAPIERPVDALAQTDAMARFIDDVAATCDAVSASFKSPKRFTLCFDEWNVWTMDGDRAEWKPAWSIAPPLQEQVHNVLDALLLGGMGLTLLARVDRVKIACLAQLVNVIAPIRTRAGGPAWRQTIFWPFHDLSRYGRGRVLRSAVRCAARIPHVPISAKSLEKAEGNALQVVVVANDDGAVTVFALNRSDALQALVVELQGFEGLGLGWWRILSSPDLRLVNTEAAPDRVRPQEATGARFEGAKLKVDLPPFSWNVLRLAP